MGTLTSLIAGKTHGLLAGWYREETVRYEARTIGSIGVFCPVSLTVAISSSEDRVIQIARAYRDAGYEIRFPTEEVR